MEHNLAIAAVWMGLALLASLLSIRFRLSVALVEILVGIAAGNVAALLDHYHVFGLHWEMKANEWIAFLAGFGSILLTFMAGAEIEPAVLRKFFKESLAIGAASFAAPFVGALLYARYVSGWDWNAALICGIALSTTSVAVVYAVMIETGLNETDFGKLILAACFITDLGTVLALGACAVPLRDARGQLHDPADVHRPDLRDHQCPVRAEQPLHHRGPVQRPGDSCDRQRGHSDPDRPGVLQAGGRAAGSPGSRP